MVPSGTLAQRYSQRVRQSAHAPTHRGHEVAVEGARERREGGHVRGGFGVESRQRALAEGAFQRLGVLGNFTPVGDGGRGKLDVKLHREGAVRVGERVDRARGRGDQGLGTLRRPDDFRAVPLQAEKLLGYAFQEGAAASRFGELHRHDANLRLGRRPHLAAKSLSEELVTEAESKEGAPGLAHPFADRRELGRDPGMLVLLPYVHRAAHADEHVEGVEVGDRLAFVKLDRLPLDAVFGHEVPKDSRVLARDVLEYEYAHVVVSGRGAAGPVPLFSELGGESHVSRRNPYHWVAGDSLAELETTMAGLRFQVLTLPNAPWDELAGRFRLLEELGFDVAAIADHFVDWTNPPSPWLESWTLLAAVARETTRIRLCTCVSQIPLREPAMLARQALTLDHISGGRLDVGLGLGLPIDPSYDMMGIANWSNRERAARFREYVAIVDRLLSNEVSSYEGRYYRIREAIMNPRPGRICTSTFRQPCQGVA